MFDAEMAYYRENLSQVANGAVEELTNNFAMVFRSIADTSSHSLPSTGVPAR